MTDRSQRFLRYENHSFTHLARQLSCCTQESLDGKLDDFKVKDLAASLERVKRHRFVAVVTIASFQPGKLVGKATHDLFESFSPGQITGSVDIFDRTTGEALCGFDVKAKNPERLNIDKMHPDDAIDENLVTELSSAIDRRLADGAPLVGEIVASKVLKIGESR
jgi:hypothetical protein